MNVPPSRKAQVYVETAFASTFADGAPFMQRLASASEVLVGSGFDLPGAVSIVTPDATIKIPMDELVDREAERARLQKERDGVQKQLDGVLARLENKAFTDKAPEAVVAGAGRTPPGFGINCICSNRASRPCLEEKRNRGLDPVPFLR